MVQLKLSPDVTDYFVLMDWNDAGADRAAFCRRLVDDYEQGRVVVLRNAPFHIDYDLLNRVHAPMDDLLKKAADDFFLRPKLWQPGVARALFRVFGPNLGLYLAFRRQVKALRGEIRDFVNTAFAGYDFFKQNISWRFAPTGPEHMHLDFFGSDEDVQYVRLFINVDAAPRIWNTSHRLGDLAPRYYESADLAGAVEPSGNDFCRRLTMAAFGWKEDVDRDDQPRHVAAFEQGDVWLCDSRQVSHQIVQGHRAVSAKFRARPASMRDPSRRVASRVQACHAAHGPASA